MRICQRLAPALVPCLFALSCGAPSDDGGGDVGSLFAAISAQKTSIAGPSRFDLYFTQPGTTDSASVDPILDDDLVSLINLATTRVDMAMYDLTRQNIIDALVAAHDRGVPVRMVGDGDNTAETGYMQLEAAGIPIVNRPAGDYIMHDKFVVVDGRFLFTGSTNATVSNILHDNNNSLILESADLAAAYTAEFDEMFVNGHFGPAKADTTSVNTTTINGATVEYYLGPHDMLLNQLLAKVDGAKHSLRFLIFTFANSTLKDHLVAQKKAGLNVLGVFDTGQASQASSQDEALATGGVPVWLDGNNSASPGGLLHHKVMIIDGDNGADPMVVTGSFNWTTTAELYNDENLVIFHSGALARAYLDEFCAVATVATVHPSYVGVADTGCAPKVIVNEALPNPVGTDSGQEYVEIVNQGLGALDLSGATITVGSTVRHKFATSFILPALGVTVVYDKGDHSLIPGAIDSTSGSLGLANSGATVTLKNAAGATVDSFIYGSTTEGVAKNRNPDVTPAAPIANHDTLAGTVGAMSPGTHADGTPFLAIGGVAAPLSSPPAPHDLVISQFATRGALSASDDFIEIYNRTGHVIDATNVRLQYETSTCGGWYTRYTVPSGTMLNPGQFYLVVNSSGYVSPASGPPPNGALSSGLADNALIRVVDSTGIELDRVAYGTGLACTGEGGTDAPGSGTTANANSVSRKPGSYSKSSPCVDSDNNAADFTVTARNPRNAASPTQASY